ncbi:SGNH/GDSL hydrolase family protein [Actinomadura rugatobispora]|uniref:SGNH/GDSL hydrolase family protein n=1 Tax=Actinomadura rugatobispora TaxID=1994 RepID=A0ABW0ZU85_9ACTN|nr:SGNH/GDSL hydrolase family protein [Actinomadura rugatobispora]
MTSRRARRGAALLALCLASFPATGCGAFGDEPAQNSSPAAASTSPVASSTPLVMFLGDSYTVGERGSFPEYTYAAATARLLGWQPVLAGQGGTGFIAGSHVRRTFGTLYESQLGWRPAPDLLIVSGGHNDWSYPPQEVGAAAHELLERARGRWPDSRIAVLGPIWGNQSPPQGALAVRDALRQVAQQLGMPFIDPIAEQWITGNRAHGTGNAARLIQRDGTHPNQEGHRYLATRLVESLKRLGLAHPAQS